MKRRLVVCAIGFAAATANAQSATQGFAALDSSTVAGRTGAVSALVTVATTNEADTRRDVIRAIGTQSGLSIVFDPTLPGLDERISAHYTRVPAATALMRALAGSGARAMVAPSGNQVVLVPRAKEARATKRVTGIVRSGEGPIAAARVEIPGTGLRATTHDDGTFVLFDVPIGDHALRVSRIGYAPLLHQMLHVAGDSDAPLELTLARDVVPLEAIVVTPGFFGLLEESSAAPQSMSREQLETVPQIGEDIYRAINRLPGVTASDFSAKFSVRGATADQLYVTLDGLRLIEPFHLKDIGSALSIIDIQTLGEASLVSGGASAAFGDQIGGVFTMRSLDPRADRGRSALGVSLTNLRANSQGSFANGKGGWLVSGRRGFLDLAFRLSNLGDSLRPSYNDLFAKLQYDLPHNGQIAVHALHSGDDLKYVDQGDENIASKYLANYLWMTVQQPLGARLRSETVLSLGALDWRRGGQSSRFVNPQAVVDDRRSVLSLEARQDWSLNAAKNSLFTFGVDVRHDRADYDYDRRSNRVVVSGSQFVNVPDSYSAQLKPVGTSYGLHLTHKLQAFDALFVETGVRYDETAGYKESLVSPRAAVAWQIAPSTTLRGSWGRYSQAQPLFSLSVEDGERTFSPADRSEQTEVALEQRLPLQMTSRVNVYRRLLVFERPRFITAGSAIQTFPEISYDRVAIPATSGQARGIELALSRAGSAIEWSASYALANATDRFGGRDVPRMNDQRHTTRFDWSYHPPSNLWRLAVAHTWHSGTPDTPDLVHIDTVVNTPTQFSISPEWRTGPLFSERVDDYRRIDIRWTRYFQTRNGRLSMFAELFNALNNENVRGYFTTVSVSSNRAVRLTREMRTQIPRLPSAGFTWEF